MSKGKIVYKENIFVKILRLILIIIFLPIVIIYALVRVLKKNSLKKFNAEKVKIYNISQTDHMTGIDFENCLKALFEAMGYRVELTKTTGDFGADLIISKAGKKSIIQAKCYSKTVGVKAVQEVISARSYYGIENAFVFANQEFSNEAKILAQKSSVSLVGRQTLSELLLKYRVQIELEKSQFSALSNESRNQILSKYRFFI